MQSDWWAKLIFPWGGTATLGPDWVWRSDDAKVSRLTGALTTESQPPFYEYSEADGMPGRLIAARLAKEGGLRVEFPEKESEKQA